MIAAAFLGLVVGSVLALPFFDAGRVDETIRTDSAVTVVAGSSGGWEWLWIGIPTALVFGAVAVYALRRHLTGTHGSD